MKRIRSFLIAAVLINSPANNFAEKVNEETETCSCALAEKHLDDKASSPLNHSKEIFKNSEENPCLAVNPVDDQTCSLPENHCNQDSVNILNPNDKACKEEKEKYSYIECDDIFSRCYPLSISHTEGHWFDNRIGYTSINFFWSLPIGVNSNYFSFVDVRGHVLNNGKTAGNLGGGIRLVNDCNRSTIFGVNAFYDFRKTTWNNYFQQIGVGLEILNSCFDLRFNGYIPLGRQTNHSRIFHHHSREGFKFSFQQRRNSLGGFDVGIGKWIVKDACGTFDFYATLGVYSYFPKKHHHNIFGGEVRLISNLIQNFSLELRAGYDTVNSTQVQIKLAAYIPLGISPCECFENKYIYNDCYLRERLCQPLFRQEIISLDKRECLWRY